MIALIGKKHRKTSTIVDRFCYHTVHENDSIKSKAIDESAQLKVKISVLEQKVEWFKRQILGRKPEKQIVENPAQDSLFAITLDSAAVDQSIDVPAYKEPLERGKK